MIKDIRPAKKVALKKTWKKVAKAASHYNETFNLYYGMKEKDIVRAVGNGKILIPIPWASTNYKFNLSAISETYPKIWFKAVK